MLGLTPTSDHIRCLGRNFSQAGLMAAIEQKGYKEGHLAGYDAGYRTSMIEETL